MCKIKSDIGSKVIFKIKDLKGDTLLDQKPYIA